MTPLQLASAVDARDDRRLANLDRKAALEAAITERAERVAADIVRDSDLLGAWLSSGDVMLHEIVVRTPDGPRTGEQLVAMAIADTRHVLAPDDWSPMALLADAVAVELARLGRVREMAEAEL